MARTLLLIFAHPDDETFLTGGSVCRYVAEGVRVVLATATRGESGKAGPASALQRRGPCPSSASANCATRLRFSGIAEVHLLGYRDRELPHAPHEEIRRQLVELVRVERPQVVVSFDPNGGNLHPDHIAISRFAADARDGCRRSAVASGTGRAARRAAGWRGCPEGAHGSWCASRTSPRAPGVDFLVDVGAWRDRKLAALLAHATQHQSVERNFLSQPDADRLLGVEVFRQAFGPRLATRPAADLFEGV